MWGTSDLGRFQVLNSSLKDPALRGRCLRGLQKVSARCGLLPKSYWLSHAPPAELSDTPFEAGKISRTRQRLIDGKLVAVKTISPDCIESFDVFKRVRTPPRKNHVDVVYIFGPGRNYVPMRSCGSGYGTRMWSVSLGSAHVLPLSPSYTLGCPTETCPSMCARTPMPIHSAWYVVASARSPILWTILILCRRQFQDVAHGLAYLHRYNLVHGNLTGVSLSFLAQ